LTLVALFSGEAKVACPRVRTGRMTVMILKYMIVGLPGFARGNTLAMGILVLTNLFIYDPSAAA
jgi:hypothetical protein